MAVALLALTPTFADAQDCPTESNGGTHTIKYDRIYPLTR
jgi:hypothetical protein